jgi:acyl-CoA reductase-like NAD-dependent aldehyde dehydrogenase
MDFLDRGIREGRIYLGRWTAGSGGEYPAVEPATGRELARVGAASAADVHKAAETALQAQHDWCHLPYDQRAAGLVHINDQTVNDEAIIPFGGVGESGTGSRHGGVEANLDAFTETQWVTVRGDLPQYPF